MVEPPIPLRDGGAASADEAVAAEFLDQLREPAAVPRSLDRVWQRIEGTAPAPKRLRRWLPATAAMVALILIVVALPEALRGRHRMRVAFVSGTALLGDPSERATLATEGVELREGQRLRIDAAGKVLVDDPRVAALLLSDGGDLQVDRLAPDMVLQLLGGTITARVAKRARGEPFVVRAGSRSVRVVGTVFSVGLEDSDRLTVSVREGTVEVTDRLHSPVRVTAGQRWTSDGDWIADRTPARVAALLAATLRGDAPELQRRLFSEVVEEHDAETGGSDTRDTGPLPVAPPWAEPSSETERSTRSESVHPKTTPSHDEPPPLVKAGSRGRGIPGSDLAPRAHRHAGDGRSAGPERSSAIPQRPALIASAEPRASHGAGPAVSPESVAADQAGKPTSPADAYDRAVDHEAAGDYREAVELFAQAAEPSQPHEDLALYELGRLDETRLDDARGALAAFHEYRSRFPRGALLPEVDFSILEIDATHRRADDALSESARFLAVHPDDHHIDEVRLLRARLLTERGACEEALPLLQAITQPSLVDDAAWSQVYCATRAGDRSEAMAAIRGYLDRFPRGAHRAEAQKALDGTR